MDSNRAATATPIVVVVLAALIVLLLPILVLGVATTATALPAGCGRAGTAQTVADVNLTAEQMDNARTIVSVTAGRKLPARAAVIALAVAYAESRLINSSVETDHDSEGLFQQRISIYTKAVADDPVNATNAFLDRLTAILTWQTDPLGDVAQEVQVSAPGASIYPRNEHLATAVVGQLWPAAAAGAAAGGTTPTDAVATTPLVLCTTGALLSSDAVKWLMFFADRGWNVPYQNCPEDCRSITGVHSCYRAYTDACRLTEEDCSGFVRWVFWNALHIDIGPDGNSQLRQGLARHWPVQVTRNIRGDWRTMGLQVGDIVFFGAGTEVYGNGTISPDPNVAGTSHVVIYVGNGQVVENGGNAWQGYHPLYNQGDYQFVMRPTLPAAA